VATPHLLVVFLLVTAAAIVWMAQVQPRDAHVVKFELATSVDEARCLLCEFDSDSWARMRKTFERDSLFILGYTCFFMVVGLGVGRFSAPLGWTVVLLALAVGVFDILENTNALEVLSTDLSDASAPFLQRMSSWSRLKWFSLGPLALAIAWADFAQRTSAWGSVGAAVFAVTGIVFAVSWLAPSLLYTPLPIGLLAAAMIVQTVVAFRQPG